MRKAPCISTDQSEIQEATTNHKGPGEFIIAGSLQKIKEERLTLITFPTTTEAFIAYQEAGIGRKLEGFEQDLACVVVDLINISYQEGMEGHAHTVSMEDVEAFFQERGKEEAFHKLARIWESICWWCDKAYQAGKEAAQHETDRSAQED